MPEEQLSRPFPVFSELGIQLIYERRFRWTAQRHFPEVFLAEHCALEYLMRIGVCSTSDEELWQAKYRDSQWWEIFRETRIQKTPIQERKLARVAFDVLRQVALALEAIRDYDWYNAGLLALQVERARQRLWLVEIDKKIPTGRKPGTTLSKESFRQQYLSLFFSLEYPTQLEVAERLKPRLSERTLRNYLKKWNLPWPPAPPQNNLHL